MTTASARVVIINELGVHARSATAFMSVASRFESQVTVMRLDTGEPADGKSIFSLLKLMMVTGTTIEIRAEGTDAQTAVDQLVHLVQAKFHEDV